MKIHLKFKHTAHVRAVLCGVQGKLSCPSMPCVHNKKPADCKVCTPCPHGRVKRHCAKCSGCEHGKLKSDCARCNACAHGKVSRFCRLCCAESCGIVMKRNVVPKRRTRRTRLSNYQRNCIAHKQLWQCSKCSILLPPTFQIDHITPISEGGNNMHVNLQAMCPNCHALKTADERVTQISSSCKVQRTELPHSVNVVCASHVEHQMKLDND